MFKLRPDWHGQRSLRPSFSISSFSPRTMRWPRLTWVSDGKPLLRLLDRSKKVILIVVIKAHGSSPFLNY